MRRRRRTSESGQVVLVTAMMATLIFGGMALAVDLSVHTFNQRTIQNVADSAALAGATDLGLVPTSAQQQSGITDALSAVQRNESFPSTWTSGFSASSCTTGGVSGYCETVTYSGFTVTVSTPPKTARSTTNATANDLEVEIYQTVSNSFAKVIGVPTSTVGAHAVGWHAGPPAPYNFTFFSAIDVESGNQQESIYGDTYVGNGYQPQSQGKAGLCVYNDSNGNGHVVFAAVPPSIGTDPTYGQSAACPGGGAFTAQAAQSTAGSPNCPSGATPTADSNGLQCVLASPPVPSITLPTTTATLCGQNGNATITYPATKGIFAVGPGCAVTLDFSNGDINCVDLVLGNGARVDVVNKASEQFMTSYDFGSDAAGVTAINKLSPTPTDLVATCPGAPGGSNPDTTATHAGNCVICSNPMKPVPSATLTNQSKGGGGKSDTLFVGTIFLPGQTVNFATNQAMEDVGSIYVGDWLVQSGNHPNPVVTHDSGNSAYTAEILRLVE